MIEEKKRKAQGASGMNLLFIYFWVTFILKKRFLKEKNSSEATVVESDGRAEHFDDPGGFQGDLTHTKV